MDDIAKWRLQQENGAKPFPHEYPQMPPWFQRCCAFTKALFLLEWICIILFSTSGLVGSLFLVVCRNTAFHSHVYDAPFSAFWALTFILPFLLVWPCHLLRHTPKFFWRCPCCGLPFPYYGPAFRGLDVLKEQDCIYSMEQFRIKWVKPKFCPLIVPSLCPECKCKFFDMAD